MLAVAHNHLLLLYAAAGIAALLVLVIGLKVHSFIGLVLASLFVGLCAGMPLRDIARAFQDGVGGVLGSIAVVVGLGTILGKLLAESGGAEDLARAIIQRLGEPRLPWAMLLIGFVVGLPVFFAVGLVLLIPLVYTLVRQTQQPLLLLGIPLVAGLSVAHGLIPPHPGPVAAIGILEKLAGKPDMGKTIIYGLIIGLPIAILAGPIFGRWISQRVAAPLRNVAQQLAVESGRRVRTPPLWLTLFTILLPVGLMILGSLAAIALPVESPARPWTDFFSSPIVAMLLAVLLALYTFGAACGFSRSQVLAFTNDCLAPVAPILLVVGAGGGFGKILDASGIGAAIADLFQGGRISPLILGWLVAASIRVAIGSATVAITMAAGIVAPLAAQIPGTNLELLVIAMGAGSLILSHVNDGGFWFVKEYFNLDVLQTLKTWTLMETIISVTALVLVLLLDLIV